MNTSRRNRRTCRSTTIRGRARWGTVKPYDGTQLADTAAVGLNACCDYNTRLREGAVLANGSATHYDQVIGADSFAEGVPAVVKKESITDRDRQAYFGLIPEEWARYAGGRQEESIRKRKGL